MIISIYGPGPLAGYFILKSHCTGKTINIFYWFSTNLDIYLNTHCLCAACASACRNSRHCSAPIGIYLMGKYSADTPLLLLPVLCISAHIRFTVPYSEFWLLNLFNILISAFWLNKGLWLLVNFWLRYSSCIAVHCIEFGALFLATQENIVFYLSGICYEYVSVASVQSKLYVQEFSRHFSEWP